MKRTIKPRKTPQQARSRQTREDILEATAHLLNRKPLDEVSTNHIAKKTGISIGTLYKYYPNKDAILADLSLEFMQQDAELFGRIFEGSPRSRQQKGALWGKPWMGGASRPKTAFVIASDSQRVARTRAR